ncbi:MAG: GntR family transcriptional regulator [Acidovorax sp.]|jgi:DNA-binding GntR family transcriptional regulator|uniref:GntR family transcriptional regulator n=1 Tax=Acidovorax sp. TaxID=1872122 RepID=UPI000A7B6245|nr:GntR family transcriptional regulator [Acidovorax sp.]MDH4425381.1 GntR family transcriptional regulator [Acidovorax sp.]MDH4447208.1 GntR family transcriptional regulator [Acidovorax sp.]MDH4463259.1 GntR family transcriptional regulator [Acidovorax sp.]
MNSEQPISAPPTEPDGTVTDRVYDAIYRAVLEHRLAPGEWLREAEMATEFKVSRTVVRQALQRLAQDQVIELRHNRGARVPLPSLEDAVHVFEARRIVECEVARRLGGRLSSEQLAELRAIAQAEQAADQRGDRAEAIRLSGDFHHALTRMHGNPVFGRLLNGLLPTTSLLMARFKVDGGQVCVAHRHADVIEALLRGSAPAAAEMRKHLAELERSLVDTPVRGRRLRDAFAAYRESSPTDPESP